MRSINRASTSQAEAKPLPALKQHVLPDGTVIEESSGNVFADLGLSNPEERMLKADLALQITRLVEARGLTQTAAARLVGVPQPHLSDILRGRLAGYSVEKMLGIINRLGRRVELRIGKRDVTPERAVTVVAP